MSFEDQEELSEELDEGHQAAMAFAQHLLVMGAAKVTHQIRIDGRVYEITAKFKCFADDIDEEN